MPLMSTTEAPAPEPLVTRTGSDSTAHQLLESDVANYILTIVAATSFIGNIVLLCLYLCVKQVRPRNTKICAVVMLIDLAQILLAFSLLLILLSRDVLSGVLCDMGGHLLLFAQQTVLWYSLLQVLLCSNLLTWKVHLYKKTSISHLVFACVLLVLLVGNAVFSFLPLSDNNYFKLMKIYPHRCVPVQKFGSVGHEYSLLLLCFDWLLLLLLVAMAVYTWLRKRSVSEQPQLPDKMMDSASVRLSAVVVDSVLLLLNQMWLTVLLLIPAGNSTQTAALRWLYLYCVAMLPVGHVIASLLADGRAYQKRRRIFLPDVEFEGGIAERLLRPEVVPESLREIQAMPEKSGVRTICNGVVNFKVSWSYGMHESDGLPGGSTTSSAHKIKVHQGCLRAFNSRVKHKWKSEVLAAVKLTNFSHPNVAHYLWISKRNIFQAALACVCPDKLDVKSRLICRQHFPLGSLRSFLVRKKNRITEGTLHLVALDVANGLSHLSRLNILHNSLSSESIFVKNCLDTTIVKVVLADFEVCQQLSEPSVKINGIPQGFGFGSSTGGISHRTGLLEALRSNMFAPDVRSFALLLLEMLLLYVQRKQEQSNRRRYNRGSSGFFSGTCSSSKFGASLGDIARRRAQLDCAASRSTLMSDASGSSVFCTSERSARLSSNAGADELYEQIRVSRTANLTPIRSKRNLRKSGSSSTLPHGATSRADVNSRPITPESVLEDPEGESAAADDSPTSPHIYQNLQSSAASFRIQGVFPSESDTDLSVVPHPPLPPVRNSSYGDAGGGGGFGGTTSESECSGGEAGQLIRTPADGAPARSLHHIKEDEAACSSSGRSSHGAPPSSSGRPDIIKTVSAGRSSPLTPPSSLELDPLDNPKVFGLSQHHILLCQKLLAESPNLFEYSGMLSAERSKVRVMLNRLESSGLQVLANNLVQLVDSAWFSEPCINADYLLERLQQVLPSCAGSVVSSV